MYSNTTYRLPAIAVAVALRGYEVNLWQDWIDAKVSREVSYAKVC